jgi:hypothetical protein
MHSFATSNFITLPTNSIVWDTYTINYGARTVHRYPVKKKERKNKYKIVGIIKIEEERQDAAVDCIP